MIADLCGSRRSDLEFPLTRHDLGVDPRDLQPSGEAGVEMLFCDLAPLHELGADPAIIRPLRRRIAVVRETIRPPAFHKGIFLLEPVPSLEIEMSLLELGERPTRIGAIRRPVGILDLAEDQNMIAAAQGIGTMKDRD